MCTLLSNFLILPLSSATLLYLSPADMLAELRARNATFDVEGAFDN